MTFPMKNIFLMIFFSLSAFIALAESPDLSLATGINYYQVQTSSDTANSQAYASDMMARIQADWTVLNNFFLGATGMIPLIKENSTESVSLGALSSINNFSVGEKNLELYGGYLLTPLFNPFLGLAVSEFTITRNPKLTEYHGLIDDQSYNNYDFLLGVRGKYEFNDYYSLGYSLTFQTSASADAEMDSKDFKNIDSSKIASSVFFKYWLPNEFMEIGLHLYGGKSLYDKKTSANDLLPDTDIKFVGAFLSLKVNL